MTAAAPSASAGEIKSPELGNKPKALRFAEPTTVDAKSQPKRKRKKKVVAKDETAAKRDAPAPGAPPLAVPIPAAEVRTSPAPPSPAVPIPAAEVRTSPAPPPPAVFTPELPVIRVPVAASPRLLLTGYCLLSGACHDGGATVGAIEFVLCSLRDVVKNEDTFAVSGVTYSTVRTADSKSALSARVSFVSRPMYVELAPEEFKSVSNAVASVLACDPKSTMARALDGVSALPDYYAAPAPEGRVEAKGAATRPT